MREQNHLGSIFVLSLFLYYAKCYVSTNLICCFIFALNIDVLTCVSMACRRPVIYRVSSSLESPESYSFIEGRIRKGMWCAGVRRGKGRVVG